MFQLYSWVRMKPYPAHQALALSSTNGRAEAEAEASIRVRESEKKLLARIQVVRKQSVGVWLKNMSSAGQQIVQGSEVPAWTPLCPLP
jgi:hypothetical protein